MSRIPISRHGLTRLELLMALICIFVLTSLLYLMFQRTVRSNVQVEDGTRLRQIRLSLLVAARDYQGRYPTPGLVNRLPLNGVETPGRGEEDESLNTTASLYSVMVMQNYLSPELLISPLERNPNVDAMDNDFYDFDAYSPATSRYWDPSFKADLVTGSNVSYGHMPLVGERKNRWWQESLGGHFALLGNRGPRDGKPDRNSYTCDRHGNWSGNIVFADGSVEWLTVMQVPSISPAANSGGLDNLFTFDRDGAADDMIVTFTSEITDGEPKIQHD